MKPHNITDNPSYLCNQARSPVLEQKDNVKKIALANEYLIMFLLFLTEVFDQLGLSELTGSVKEKILNVIHSPQRNSLDVLSHIFLLRPFLEKLSHEFNFDQLESQATSFALNTTSGCEPCSENLFNADDTYLENTPESHYSRQEQEGRYCQTNEFNHGTITQQEFYETLAKNKLTTNFTNIPKNVAEVIPTVLPQNSNIVYVDKVICTKNPFENASETYNSVSKNFVDSTDEYRSDDDPGYRIRDIIETDFMFEVGLRVQNSPLAANLPFFPVVTCISESWSSAPTTASSCGFNGISHTSRLPTTETVDQTYSSPEPSRGESLSSFLSITTRGINGLEESFLGHNYLESAVKGFTAESIEDGPYQRRPSSPTFGEDLVETTAVGDNEANCVKVLYSPKSPDDETIHKAQLLLDNEKPLVDELVKRVGSPLQQEQPNAHSSPEFGLGRSCDILSSNACHKMKKKDTESSILLSKDVDDELTFCISDTSRRYSEQLVKPSKPRNVVNLKEVDELNWMKEYSNGDFDLYRKRMSKKKKKIYESIKHPPSSSPIFPLSVEGKFLDCFNLRVIYECGVTGLKDSNDLEVTIGMKLAGHYIVQDYLGEASFSRTYRCYDTLKQIPVCIKVVRNKKDYFDQSLDEIKLLRLLNLNGNSDQMHYLQLYDYVYYDEHLLLVTELLETNLYMHGLKVRENNGPGYTMGQIQKIAYQILTALNYVHSLQIMHADLKPENIMFKSVETYEVKVIDFGSSQFTDDKLASYVQSRSYRAPEVILELPYDQKIDMWSLGCVVAELWTGRVLFRNDSVISLITRIVGIVGTVPKYMACKSRNFWRHLTQEGQLFESLGLEKTRRGLERNLRIYLPKPSSLKQRMKTDDAEFLDFLKQLLQIDPAKRMTAAEALKHPWLTAKRYSDGLQ